MQVFQRFFSDIRLASVPRALLSSITRSPSAHVPPSEGVIPRSVDRRMRAGKIRESCSGGEPFRLCCGPPIYVGDVWGDWWRTSETCGAERLDGEWLSNGDDIGGRVAIAQELARPRRSRRRRSRTRRRRTRWSWL